MIFIKPLKNTIQIKIVRLIVFDDMIADMLNNKKLNPIVTELFIRGRKVNISVVFIIQCYFPVSKNIRLNKSCTLFYYENSKQTRTSKNCIQ